jgi:hypothetical protein
MTKFAAQIEAMIANAERAQASGQILNAQVVTMIAGAKAALACTDAAWWADSRLVDAKTVCIMAAQGDVSGAGKLI